ncbi:MAG: purine-nucleoside phosphorylase [Chitinophagaceae bacterium]
MSDLLQSIQNAASFIQGKISGTPHLGIILGSGLGNFFLEMKVNQRISFDQIPHFPATTIEGHIGELIFGDWGGENVMVMSGRFHYYEGLTMEEVTFPIRVMKQLGIRNIFLTNAAGGINPDFRVGDLMIIRDHINLQPEHPLRGFNHLQMGPRFPDMSCPYSSALISIAQGIAQENKIPIHTGVYVGVQGPSFETRAEYQYLRVIGGDAVGMSTIPEVIVAVHTGLEVFAISVITNIGIRKEDNFISHEEVLLAAREASPRLTTILLGLIQWLHSHQHGD